MLAVRGSCGPSLPVGYTPGYVVEPVPAMKLAAEEIGALVSFLWCQFPTNRSVLHRSIGTINTLFREIRK